jgi:UDP-N-acetylglucosamine transferase subunit ALG13
VASVTVEQMGTRQFSGRLCLAGSGGGHIRQILDLKPLWQGEDSFIITENTVLGRSLREDHDVEFVEHYALGQARLGHPLKMLRGALRNARQSWRILKKRRPDVLISTGAGATFFSLLAARALGAKIILIDSMARVDAPSAFARLAGRFAHVRVSQSPRAGAQWGNAVVFDSLRVLSDRPPPKEDILFATVGATLPFDRLIEMVASAKQRGLINCRVIAQVGEGGRVIEGFETHESIPFEEVKALLRRARMVVCHGGTGSLITALQAGCKTIAVPRRFHRTEHYDDHQLEITSAFAGRGLIKVVDTQDEFDAALLAWQSEDAQVATRDPSEMLGHLRELLGKWLTPVKVGMPARTDAIA